MTEWRSIETAPKDRWILIWAAGSNVRDVAWYNFSGKHGWSEDGRSIINIEPTHWMPLPFGPDGKF